MHRYRAPVRGVLLPVGTWLAGAALAVSVGFLAIHRVGDDLDSGVQPLSDSELQQSALVAAHSTSLPETTGPSSAAAGTEPATDTPGGAGPGATTPGATTTAAAPATSTGPPPATPSRRFTTKGGVVAVSCSGPTITLVYAYPANGYTSQVEREPGKIEVEFHSRNDEDHLNLRCVHGEPTEEHTGDGE